MRVPSSPSPAPPPQLQPSKRAGGALRTARPAPRTRGAAAQAVLTGCRLWGNMAPAAAGLPRSAALAARLPALPRLHTRCAKGTGAATPADCLPSAAAGSSGARRGSVPPPRGHSPAAASFVAVVPRRAEGGRERRTGRAWDGHQRPALFRLRFDRRAAPATPGRGGTGLDGAQREATAAPQRRRIIPFTASQVVDAIVRPEIPGGGDYSLLFCPLSKGENPAGGSGSQRPRRDRRKPRGAKESLQAGTRFSQASAQGPNHRQDTER